jgi:Fe-S-cluster-containing dehydrogenase component
MTAGEGTHGGEAEVTPVPTGTPSPEGEPAPVVARSAEGEPVAEAIPARGESTVVDDRAETDVGAAEATAQTDQSHPDAIADLEGPPGEAIGPVALEPARPEPSGPAPEQPSIAREPEPVEPGRAEPSAAIEPQVANEPPTALEPALASVQPPVAIEPPVAAAPPALAEPEHAQPVSDAAPEVVAIAQPELAELVPADLVPLSELGHAIVDVSVSRRAFLGFGLTVVGGLAGAAILTKYVPIFSEPAIAPPPIVRTYDPIGKAWTFVVDSAACIGCGLCVVACKEENSVTQDPEFNRTWVERHAVAGDGVVYIDAPAGGAAGFPAESTASGAQGQVIDRAFFEPRLCMQCENSPCTSVCPVGATYRTADGIILVDARRCIGCGYCVVACPYGARYIAPAGEDAPNGTPGVADKCTWCYHRISRGDLPACVDICPVGARKFGDAADPTSEISMIVRDRVPKPLHPEYGTRPRVLYLGPATEEA